MMSTREFLGLEQSGASTWRMPVVERTTGNSRQLFGGVGLAAGIIALEAASGRPVVWATGQYVARLEVPSVLELDVALLAAGHFVTQGSVRASSGERDVLTVIGAAGRRAGATTTQALIARPVAPPPDDCEPVLPHVDGVSIHDHVELRRARGMFGFNGQGAPSGDGRTLLWARMPDVVQDAAGLALMADYMASAVGNALGTTAHCTSLDNTIRFPCATPADAPEWVLCESQIDAVDGGIAHGSCHMWSEHGQLLAVASQSMSVSSNRR